MSDFMSKLHRRNVARRAGLGAEVSVVTAEDLEPLSERVTALETRCASIETRLAALEQAAAPAAAAARALAAAPKAAPKSAAAPALPWPGALAQKVYGGRASG